MAGVTLIAATDVDNPLLGLRGAAARNHGEQKGASPSECMDLDAALEHFAGLVGRRPDGKDPAVALGAGAAGGLGYALLQLGESASLESEPSWTSSTSRARSPMPTWW